MKGTAMKRTITTAALLLFALPALAADPQPAPQPEPIDPKVAMAVIKSIQAEQEVIDARATQMHRQAMKQVEAVRQQCGAPCAEPTATEAPKPAAPETPKQ